MRESGRYFGAHDDDEQAQSAGVAELADAMDLGSIVRKDLQVRPLSPAPTTLPFGSF